MPNFIDAKTQRERYRNDPIYRANRLAQSKRRHERLKDSHTYQRLTYISKKITRRRDSIEIFLERIRKLEKSLLRLVKMKEKLQEKFKKERLAQKLDKEFKKIQEKYPINKSKKEEGVA